LPNAESFFSSSHPLVALLLFSFYTFWLLCIKLYKFMILFSIILFKKKESTENSVLSRMG
jgi:hypothetical protein